MDLICDVLDKQVLDRKKIKIGKVDSLVMVMDGRARPRIAYVETGVVALARRLGPHWGALVSLMAAFAGGETCREPFRIPWAKITDIGIDVEAHVDMKETPFHAWQEWLRRKVIARIPGT